VTRLLVEPPPELPPALVHTLEDEQRQHVRLSSMRAIWGYSWIAVVLALIPLLDVRNWTLLVSFYGMVALLVVWVLIQRWTGNTRPSTSLVINGLTVVVFGRLASGFVITPIVTMGVLLGFAAKRELLARKWLVMIWLAVVTLVPVALEWAGVLPASFTVENDGLITRSDFFFLRGHREAIALVGANLGILLICGGSRSRSATRAGRRSASSASSTGSSGSCCPGRWAASVP
jgi:hypothetical protein